MPPAVTAIADVPLAQLHAWDRNPRTITAVALERLKRSLAADPDMLQARPCIARPDGTVILGSGMTMVASEQLGRVCYGMEIDPGYTAVSLQRLADMGLTPRRAPATVEVPA